MSRTRLALVAFASAAALSGGSVMAANIALPEVNPNARPVGTTTFGNVPALDFLNDGVDGGTTGASMFQVPVAIPGVNLPAGSRGFGYDFGGVATIESLDLSQFTGESPLGPRARLADIVVHYAGGSLPLTLEDVDDAHIAFPSPVVTPWLMIETLTQHPGNDPQVGIDELAVNSASGVVLPLRTNVALGKTATRRGANWNNVNGDFTDGIVAGSGGDLSSAAFNASPTAAGESIDVDLGEALTVDALGLVEHDYGGAGGRALAQDVRLEFSDDPNFDTISATRELTLGQFGYQQLDFDPATGQYVRLSFLSQYPGNDGNLGFTEIQLFQTIPEPSALSLAALALPLMLRRRRRQS